MNLTGFHHLTAVTANAKANLAFYTQTLGLRLAKKTVNQDDTSAYHLFYADGHGSPGTDITFFDWPAARERRGSRSVVRTGFRVPSVNSLNYWAKRFDELKVDAKDIAERDGRPVLDFEDFEGQRLSLVVDNTAIEPWHAWEKSAVPAEHQVRGLGAITMSVEDLAPTAKTLIGLMNMRHVREYETSGAPTHVYQMAPEGTELGTHGELHVVVEPSAPRQFLGAGGVHHVAFRTPTLEQYLDWAARLEESDKRFSGPVDRFYFKSLYFREPSGVLFEIATDGPGFHSDEPMESMGEKLALPPFLEPHRKDIEAGLKPL